MRLAIKLFQFVTYLISLLLKPMVPQNPDTHHSIGYGGVGLGVLCLLPILVCVWVLHPGDQGNGLYFAAAMYAAGFGILLLTVSASWFRAGLPD